MPDTAVSDPFATLNLEPVSTVDRVAEELRRSLFEGELGPGTALREVALAAALGVSRSTVREALGLLVAEGLAVHVPNRGTQVRRLDPDQVRDVCQARAVIETAGVHRWHEADESLRDDVRRALRSFADLTGSDYTAAQFTAHHLDIHRALAALTGSERLVAAAESLYAEVRLALAHVDRARGNATEQVHSHSDLLSLLESSDLDAATEELAAHLAGAEASMLEAIGFRE
ncbi:MAG: GntR family transcriptional regulator [Marmoricola sp.]|jgi:DNA-binding GntR family transcriptional regulator|nr:GntR family transcriptional regulator [Marmoricola sp.]